MDIRRNEVTNFFTDAEPSGDGSMCMLERRTMEGGKEGTAYRHFLFRCRTRRMMALQQTDIESASSNHHHGQQSGHQRPFQYKHTFEPYLP